MAASIVTNRTQLAELLRTQAVANAYALGYLDPRYADQCTWLGDRDDEGELCSVVLVYSGLSRPGLFTAGRREGIRPVLRELREQLPDRCIGHIAKDHRDAVLSVYEGGSLRRVSRMGLTRGEYRALEVGGAAAPVEVLSHRDTAQILALYSHWPDNFFEPYQLESGLYFGVRDETGVLACIAGVHNVSETFDVAAIGNLVTHPERRGRGYAAACTGALLSAVFDRVGLVTLDVAEDNAPAFRTYRRFGFQHYGDHFEGELIRR